MIIQFILFLCRQLSFFDSFMKKLSNAYLAQISWSKVNAEQERQLLEKKAQLSLNKIVTFEKLGQASGLPMPKVYKKG